MFQLHDLKESKVWKEAEQIGEEKGARRGREEERAHSIQRLQTMGTALKEIADLLGIPLAEVRRLARKK